MSTPSQHSEASSSTWNFAHLNAGRGRGDNRSTHKNGMPATSQDGHGRHRAREAASPGRGPDSSQDSRRAETRRAAGFLLPSAFRRSSDGDRSFSGTLRTTKLDSKGKRRAENGHTQAPAQVAGNIRVNGSGRSSTVIGPSSGDGHEPRGSTESDAAWPGEYGSGSQDIHGQNTPAASQDSASKEQPSSAIYPSQIVNMALNLSERRRNISGSPLPQHQAAPGRRVLSSGVPVLHGNHASIAGGSLRHHLQQQRQISRNITPTYGRRLPGSRLQSSTYSPPNSMEPSDGEPAMQYHFSSATLARADKARRYIELADEYRRLLQFLPPLVPSAESQSSLALDPFQSQAIESTAIGSNESSFGRPYNPLQLIRNRKARGRARVQLDPDEHHWDDPAIVHDWIDGVTDASHVSGYSRGDQVALPKYTLDDYGAQKRLSHVADSMHSRNGSVVKRPTRPRLDWFTHPSELLADAYWLEQDHHKSMIEDHHGDKIYPPITNIESLHPKASFESHRSHHGSTKFSVSSHKVAESDQESRLEDRGRENSLPQHGRSDSSGRLRHVWQKARGRSHSPLSGFSHSDDETGDGLKRVKTGQLADEDNVGPLERHMNSMLNVEFEALDPTAPSLISPGTPNKWGLDQSEHRRKLQRRDDEIPFSQGSINRDTPDLSSPLSGSKRPRHSESQLNDGRPSMDDLSTNPNSPVSTSFMPSIAVDLSPPPSRKNSPTRWPMKSKLPFIRSEPEKGVKSGEIGNALHDEIDATASRQPSEEPPYPRQSMDSVASPTRPKGLKQHKTNDSLSSLHPQPSSRGKDGKEVREPDSAMRRFFKGGRLGELVRNEGAKVGGLIRKRDNPHDEEVDMQPYSGSDTMDESDTEDTSGTGSAHGKLAPMSKKSRKLAGSLKPHKERSANGPRADKSRYHIDLPIFKPTSSSPNASQPSTPGRDHIAEQHRNLSSNRSPRYDKLLPPNLDLSRITTESTSSITQTQSYIATPQNSRKTTHAFPHFHRSTSHASKRLAAVLDIPGGVSTGHFPTGLSAVPKSLSASQTGLLSDQRHWSISDSHPSSRPPRPHAATINYQDIARVRTLLLCSGVKAAELARRERKPRDAPPTFLEQAAKSTSAVLLPVPRKEEHVVAARLLTSALDDDTLRLHRAAESFRADTVAPLHAHLSDLHASVSNCVERARNTADEAVGFGSMVTGRKTIELRRVVDALEKFRRKRRRRLKWIRRMGFGLLEWGVLLFMWWVWLVVVIVKGVWSLCRGTFRAVKWVFWLS